MRYHIVLFDLDGTLTESGIGITRSVAYALRKHGIEEPDQKKLDRISELTRISRVRDLTAEEQAERESLRNEYRAAMRASLEGNLSNTYIQYPDGTKKKVERKD